MGLSVFPNGILAPNMGSRSMMFAMGNVWFVDGDNGLSSRGSL